MGAQRTNEVNAMLANMNEEERLVYFANAHRATSKIAALKIIGDKEVQTYCATLDCAVVPDFDDTKNNFTSKGAAKLHAHRYRAHCKRKLDEMKQLNLNFETKKEEEVTVEPQKGDGSEGNRDVLVEISRTLERIEKVITKAWG